MIRILMYEFKRMLPRSKSDYESGRFPYRKGRFWTDDKDHRWLYITTAIRNRIPFLRRPIKSYTMTPAMQKLFGERAESQ